MAELTTKEFYAQTCSQAGIYTYLNKEDFHASDYQVAVSTFNAAFNQGKSTLKSRSNQQQVSNLMILNNYAAQGIDVTEIISQLNEDGTLEQILEAGVETINGLISAYGSSSGLSSYASMRSGGYSAFFSAIRKSTYSSKGITSTDIDRFFSQVLQAQHLIDSSQDKAIALVKALAKGRKSVEEIDTTTIEQAGSVAKILYNMVTQGGFYKGNTNVNVQSIIGSLNNLYGSVLGEEIVVDFFENLPNNATISAEVDNAIENGLVTAAKGSNTKVTWTGKESDAEGHTFKSDVGMTGLLEYSASKQDDSNYTLSLASNISAKWSLSAEGGTGKSTLHIISKTPLSRWLNQLGVDNSYAANIFAHEGSNSESWTAIRNALASNFFNQWLQGSDSGGLAQYLMVNGKVYSMLSVISNALTGLDGGNNVIKVSFSGTGAVASANVIQSPPQRRRVAAAVRRNKQVRNALNNIVLSASFNTNYLTLTE